MTILRIFFVFAMLVLGRNANAQDSRPNIVIFFIDDMGWMDSSVPFGDSIMALNQRYHTPNMEQLSRHGMKFTNAYATPVCTPSRISMITGLNVANHRVTNWTSTKPDSPTDVHDDAFSLANWNYNGFSGTTAYPHAVQATPFPQLLKEQGYFTIHVGKAHWGPSGTPGANPYNLGFIVNIAGHAAGHPQSYLGIDNFGNIAGKSSAQAVPDLQEYHGRDIFLTEALTLEAIKSLEDPIKNKRPFLLHMAHYAVHDPLQADKRFVQKYLNKGLSEKEANYAGLIEGMDKSLGDLLLFLEHKGVTKNTIIIFISDNGALSLSYARDGGEHTQNLPLKAGKGSVYEGGIRVPMIVKWPGVVKPGSRSRQPVIIEDLFPTILEMAGINKNKTIQSVDGRSIVPVLKNPDSRLKDISLIWHFPNKWTNQDGPGINYFSAIREGDWKLVYNMRKQKSELYNLHTDIGEKTDLSVKYPDKVKELAKKLSDRLRKLNAPMPTFKQTGKKVPLPDKVLTNLIDTAPNH